jgi:hypothetical protein
MALLSEAFVIGMTTFRDLKAIGDMNERLRAATSQIRDDLQADHFEGRKRLGDSNFWTAGAQGQGYVGPTQGFFHVYSPTANPMTWNGSGLRPGPSFSEGPDGDGILSNVITDSILHFSVKQRANREQRYFSAKIHSGSPLLPPPPPLTTTLPTIPTTIDPSLGSADARYQDPNQSTLADPYGATYASPWAEVAYFLLPNGDLAGSTPLYTLYRAQYVVTPDNSQLNWPSPGLPSPLSTQEFQNYQEMSCELYPVQNPAQVYFNSPSDLAGVFNGLGNPTNVQPLRAFNPLNPAAKDINTGALRSATFVVGDVISFEVQVLMPGALTFVPVPDFDTGTELSIALNNLPRTINAIQITLRVWDKKTLQTRQITIVQDM